MPIYITKNDAINVHREFSVKDKEGNDSTLTLDFSLPANWKELVEAQGVIEASSRSFELEPGYAINLVKKENSESFLNKLKKD